MSEGMNEGMNLGATVWVEALKARRSRLPWLTAAAIALAPLGGGLFMLVLKDPALAQRLTLLSTKTQLLGGGRTGRDTGDF